MDGKGYSNTVLLDMDGDVARKYQAIGIPISFIIDKNGKIFSKLVGYVDWKSSKMKSAIEDLINER